MPEVTVWLNGTDENPWHRLDSSNPLALVARAAVGEWLHQPGEADSLLTHALAIDPTSTWVWERCAYGWLCENPNRAIAGFQRALRLRRPGVARTNCLHGIANAHLLAGRWGRGTLVPQGSGGISRCGLGAQDTNPPGAEEGGFARHRAVGPVSAPGTPVSDRVLSGGKLSCL